MRSAPASAAPVAAPPPPISTGAPEACSARIVRGSCRSLGFDSARFGGDLIPAGFARVFVRGAGREEEEEGQREMAAEEGAMSPTRMLAEGHLRVATGGGAPADGGIAVRHLPHHHPAKKGDRSPSICIYVPLPSTELCCEMLLWPDKCLESAVED